MSFLRPFRTHLHSNILLFSASLTLPRAVALGVHNRLNSNLLDRIQSFSPKPCHTKSPLLVSHTLPVSHKRALIKRRECTYTQQKEKKNAERLLNTAKHTVGICHNCQGYRDQGSALCVLRARFASRHMNFPARNRKYEFPTRPFPPPLCAAFVKYECGLLRLNIPSRCVSRMCAPVCDMFGDFGG